jgi:hypothetical protein
VKPQLGPLLRQKKFLVFDWEVKGKQMKKDDLTLFEKLAVCAASGSHLFSLDPAAG